jgi:hypothetical protein
MAAGEWLAVAGFFDPLTAEQARRIAAFETGGRGLLAIVLDEPDTLLTAEARAALVAGLRTVRLVTVAKPGEWRGVIGQDARVEISEDDAGEQRRSAEFVRFVVERHG